MSQRIVNHLDTELSTYQVFADSGAQSEARKALRASLGLYPGRALCTTEPGDVLQLPLMIKDGWDWITQHYKRIGLSHATEVIWDNSLELLGETSSDNLSVFMFGNAINDVCSDTHWLEIVHATNSKNKFMDLCRSLNVPIPVTACFHSKNEIADLSIFSFPVFLKADQSVSGLGIVPCSSQDELEHAIVHLDEQERFQIQESVLAQSFLNLQYRVDANGACRRLACTQQILSGYTHAGNVYPAQCEPWSMTDKLASFMANNGMKGVFGFDVAVCGDTFYVIECNPRYNGSTYPTIIAEKLSVPAWSAQTYSTPLRSLDGFSLEDVEYDCNSKTGVVVVNWGAIEQGKLGVLIAGDTEQRKAIEKRLVSLLNP